MYSIATAAAVIIFVVFWLVLTIGIGRFGPKRGNWGNPAAKLRPPDTRTRRWLYVGALLQLLLGVGIFLFVSPAREQGPVALILITLAAAGFFVACAECMRIVARVERRRSRRGASAAAGDELED